MTAMAFAAFAALMPSAAADDDAAMPYYFAFHMI